MEVQVKSCKEIISDMIDIIPKDQESLIRDLTRDCELYEAKNMDEKLQRKKTMETIYRYMQRPQEDWEYQVVSILTNIPIERIKKNQERIHSSKEQLVIS